MAAETSVIVLLLIDFLAIDLVMPKIPRINISRAIPYSLSYITIPMHE